MDIPIEIFLSFIGLSIVMGIVGIWKKIPFLMLVAGSMIAFWAVTTDNILMGETLIQTDNIIASLLSLDAEQATQTGMLTLSGGGVNPTRASEFVNGDISPLVGLDVNTISLKLSKTGSPTGLLSVGIFNNDALNFVKVFNTKDSTTLTNTQTFYNFSLPDNEEFILNSTHRVGLQFSSGSAGNTVNFGGSLTVNTYPQAKCQFTISTSAWSDCTSNVDMTFRLYGENDVREITSNSYEDNLLPFNEYPKILFALIGSMLLIGGALMWKIEE